MVWLVCSCRSPLTGGVFCCFGTALRAGGACGSPLRGGRCLHFHGAARRGSALYPAGGLHGRAWVTRAGALPPPPRPFGGFTHRRTRRHVALPTRRLTCEVLGALWLPPSSRRAAGRDDAAHEVAESHADAGAFLGSPRDDYDRRNSTPTFKEATAEEREAEWTALTASSQPGPTLGPPAPHAHAFALRRESQSRGRSARGERSKSGKSLADSCVSKTGWTREEGAAEILTLTDELIKALPPGDFMRREARESMRERTLALKARREREHPRQPGPTLGPPPPSPQPAPRHRPCTIRNESAAVAGEFTIRSSVRRVRIAARPTSSRPVPRPNQLLRHRPRLPRRHRPGRLRRRCRLHSHQYDRDRRRRAFPARACHRSQPVRRKRKNPRGGTGTPSPTVSRAPALRLRPPPRPLRQHPPRRGDHRLSCPRAEEKHPSPTATSARTKMISPP